MASSWMAPFITRLLPLLLEAAELARGGGVGEVQLLEPAVDEHVEPEGDFALHGLSLELFLTAMIVRLECCRRFGGSEDRT